MYKKAPSTSSAIFYSSIVLLMIVSSVEWIVAIVFTLFSCSPTVSEKRVRNSLRILCCCVIRDNEIIDSVVSNIMKLPSFRSFSFTDILAGLLMTNMVFHDKNRVIKQLVDPDERLRVRMMRVHEYIEYVYQHRIFSLLSSHSSISTLLRACQQEGPFNERKDTSPGRYGSGSHFSLFRVCGDKPYHLC